MGIELVTYNASVVTPKHDAVLRQTMTPQPCGTLYGCEVTVKNANTLHVNAGMGVIYGREFEIIDCDVPVTLSSSGTLEGRLYIHMDLSNEDSPIKLIVETASALSTLRDDPLVNVNTGATDMELATFSVGTGAVSNIKQTAPELPMTASELDALRTGVASKAPIKHASSGTTYGAATTELYGHVKYGTTAGTACMGNDSRLSDKRTPLAHASSGTTYGAATTELYGHVKYGTTAGTACMGNDSRLSDKRTPLAHASSGTTYGAATTELYGHAKLTSTISTSETLAATPKAVKIAYDIAKAALPAADVSHSGKGITATACPTSDTTKVLTQSFPAGTYIIYGQMYVNAPSTASGYVDLHIYSGTSKVNTGRVWSGGNSVRGDVSVFTTVTLSATTNISLYVSNGTGTDFTCNADSARSYIRYIRIK